MANVSNGCILFQNWFGISTGSILSRATRGMSWKGPGLVVLAFLLAGIGRIAPAQVTIQSTVGTKQNSPSISVSSPVFSTAGKNELLLAFIATDALGGTNTTVVGVSGGGLPWILVKRTNRESGTAEIWRAFAPAVLSNARVTATLSQAVVSSIAISSFTGVATSGSNGSGAIGAVASGYAASGAPRATLVTTQNGSLVVGVGNDYDNAIPRVPLSGQSILYQDLSSTDDTYWAQRVNAPVASKGTTVIFGDSSPTSDRFNVSICEVLPPVSALTSSASGLSFGPVTDGTTAKQSLTLKSSGSNPVTISSDSIRGTGFSVSGATLPATLTPGQSLALTVSFAPRALGSVSGQLTINSNSASGSKMTVNLGGAGTTGKSVPTISLSASTLAFGDVDDGSSEVLSVTLTSTGGSSLTIHSAAVGGSSFSLVAGSWPQILASGKSLTIQIKFAPTVAASETGKLTIYSNSSTGGTSTVGLTGTGTANPELTISPTSISFGTVDVGSSSTRSLTLTSNGTMAVKVSSGSVSGSGFTLAAGSFPLTLNPKATATLSIKFAPTTSGSDSGSLLLRSNSRGGSTTTVPLSGSGQAAYSVSLSWNPPSSSPVSVAGYNVYRAASASGAFGLLNSTLDQQSSYVDSTVSSGTTYVYEVKSVSSSGVESASSNQYSVSIP